MLDEVASDESFNPHLDGAAVTWLPDGRGFVITNIKQFEAVALPKYFSSIQYKSFVRQLNIYGFHRVSSKGSPEYGAYFHPLFVRGRPDLCLAMKRQKIKGTGCSRRKKGVGEVASHPNGEEVKSS